ncbi:MAG: hypothetical protein AAFX06_26095 [Planctomycetota bacterium]
MSKKVWFLILAVSIAGIAWLAASRQGDQPGEEIAALKKKERERRRNVSGEIKSQADDDSSLDQLATALVAARPSIDLADGYIGSQSCKSCHAEYHQSWHTSYHRTMTQPVTPDTVPLTILQQRMVQVKNQTYRFSRRGDEFFVELNDPIADNKRLTRKLVMITGSHHMQVFWYESGYDKTPAQLQIMYYLVQDRWIPRRSAFLRPPTMDKEDELGRWNGICVNCHSTHPRSRPPEEGEENWETRVSEFGITCEACHGPAEAHVAFHESKDVAALSTKDPIVNPLDLPHETRSDMCGQCHGMMMVSIKDEADKEHYFEHGRGFRPGTELDDAPFLQVVRASKEHTGSDTFRKFDSLPGVTIGHFWPDGELRVTGRDYSGMIESKCFQEGELSCLSCHTMHEQDPDKQAEWRDDQLLPNMRSDAACLQCHPKYEELGSEHTHHPIDSEGSRCMNCHMPHTIYGILKSSRSHTISSPSVATTLETGRPNACNLCHLDHTLKETASHLAEWYDHDVPELNVVEQTTAASIFHFLTGDAAQRVLQMNAYQWPPAQEASGTDWMKLYLLFGMDDPYDAIRLISERAYQSLPGNPPLKEYDFLDSPQSRGAALGREFQKIFSQRRPPNEALLINEEGKLDTLRIEALMRRRNNRPVYLQE